MAEKLELFTVDPSALQGLEVVDLVADWNAGEQIDISLLLEQFDKSTGTQGDVQAQPQLTVTDIPPQPGDAPGDVIIVDLTGNGGLVALYGDLPTPPPEI